MRRWSGLAPFLLGAAASVVVETGLGLLLYVSPGLLPALTVLLAVSLGSLSLGVLSVLPFPPLRKPSGGANAQGPALGLASGPGQGSTRWRWFVAAGGLLVAAVVSVGWTFGVTHQAGPLLRGLHLAGLLALPLYGLGLCAALTLGGGEVHRAVAAGLAGGVIGVVVLGVLLVPRAEPVSVYLFCLLCVSAAALLHRRA